MTPQMPHEDANTHVGNEYLRMPRRDVNLQVGNDDLPTASLPTNKTVSDLVNHLQNNRDSLRIASELEFSLMSYFRERGFGNFNTPIITHGMQEYMQDLTPVILSSNSVAYLRHSPQFQKQLIAMAGGTPYIQKAPCVRASDVGQFHVPYLHQLDLEIPFSSTTVSADRAMITTRDVIKDAIITALRDVGIAVSRVECMGYHESMQRYGSDAPYFEVSKGEAALTIVEFPPLLQRLPSGEVNTSILPMAAPVWRDDQERLFQLNRLPMDSLLSIPVYGFDFVISAPAFYREVRSETDETIREGVEVAGGSVRIKSPLTQRAILEIVRNSSIKSFDPLIELLHQFQDKCVFTAGGAIGLERLSMVGSRVNHITSVQAMPWSAEGLPPFL